MGKGRKACLIPELCLASRGETADHLGTEGLLSAVPSGGLV